MKCLVIYLTRDQFRRDSAIFGFNIFNVLLFRIQLQTQRHAIGSSDL